MSNYIIKKYSFAYFRKVKKYSKEDDFVTEKKKVDKGANINFALTLSERSAVNTIKKYWIHHQLMFK